MIRSGTSFAALSAALSLLAPTAAWAEDDGDAAPTIVVTGHRDTDHASSLKTDTPLLDTPQTVNVLTREAIEDHAFVQLNDALVYVPGVSLGQGEGHRDQIIIRGQSSTADFFLDGVRDDAQYYRPLYNTERVEVLKGANALLFGRGGGGGVINRVSKAPRIGVAELGGAASVDSYGAWSLSADINQPLGENLAARVNATYEEFANHRDVYDGHFIGVAPTLSVKLGEATRLTLAYEYAEDRRVTDRGIPSLGKAPIRGYDHTFFGDRAINRSELTAHFARARIDHELSGELTLSAIGQYATYDKYYGNIVPGAATATTVSLSGYEAANTRENWIGQVNLVWKAQTGIIAHTLLAGFEAAQQDSSASRSDARFPGNATTYAATLGRTITVPAVTWTPPTSSSTSDVRSLSFYVQDQIEFGEHIQVIAGARYDDFRVSSLNRMNNVTSKSTDGKWSPRLGLVVKPVPELSIYASYAKSFLPQSGDQFNAIANNTASLDPEEFRNLEAGIKLELGEQLHLNAAAFQVDRLNTRVADPANNGYFLTSGRNRVQGFELAVDGRITPAWQLSAGYSYQEGFVRSDITSGSSRIPAGTTLDKLPRHQFSAWSRYDVSEALGLGLGVVHQSGQFAALSNSTFLPGFTRVDAAAFFDVTDRIAVQVNAENLFDTEYYPSAHTDNNIAVGKPLTGKLSVRAKF